jgi:hypothetical protein
MTKLLEGGGKERIHFVHARPLFLREGGCW